MSQTDLRVAIDKALYAYGMAFKCEHDAKKAEPYGGSTPVYLYWSTEYWLDEARQWRRIAEGMQ